MSSGKERIDASGLVQSTSVNPASFGGGTGGRAGGNRAGGSSGWIGDGGGGKPPSALEEGGDSSNKVDNTNINSSGKAVAKGSSKRARPVSRSSRGAIPLRRPERPVERPGGRLPERPQRP